MVTAISCYDHVKTEHTPTPHTHTRVKKTAAVLLHVSKAMKRYSHQKTNIPSLVKPNYKNEFEKGNSNSHSQI